MKHSGDSTALPRARGHAMAGRRSPWGGGTGDDHKDEGDEVGEEAGKAAPAEGEEPGATPAETPPPATPPRNPWLPSAEQPPRRPASLDDIFRARRDGPGAQGRPPGGPLGGLGDWLRLPALPAGLSWLGLLLGGAVLVWLATTSIHVLGASERGLVTSFGRYERTLAPGLSLTAPWPFEDVAVTDIGAAHVTAIPDGEGERLVLTRDQDLVSLAYTVRWRISDLRQYSFQLADPDASLRGVAEAAVRASVAEVNFDTISSVGGQAEIALAARARAQAVLDAYHAGITVQAIDITRAGPPAKVADAFASVATTQKQADAEVATAQATAQQTVAEAQGEAAAFNEIYAQYKAAPEITRRRMYYATMEKILAHNDKVIVAGNSGTTLALPTPDAPAPTAAAGAGK